ncbi:hypothetical protein LguiA_013193 [Lonicera macranthoides]
MHFPVESNHEKYWKSAVCRIPLGVEFIVFGFGYDDAKDDYKVVRMVQFYGYNEESFWSEWVSGVLASGALHWVVSRKRRSWGGHSSVHLILEVRNIGCLCLLFKYSFEFEMWVMDDYGVENSWTKLMSVRRPNVYRFSNIVLPVAYLKSHKQVLLMQMQLIVNSYLNLTALNFE